MLGERGLSETVPLQVRSQRFLRASVIPLAASPIACAHLLVILPPVLFAKGGSLLEEQGREVQAPEAELADLIAE